MLLILVTVEAAACLAAETGDCQDDEEFFLILLPVSPAPAPALALCLGDTAAVLIDNNDEMISAGNIVVAVVDDTSLITIASVRKRRLLYHWH
jgi:hypothetical protein